MGNTNNKSGVLVGQLQSYCAACELVGKNDEFEDHLLADAHKDNFAKCTLVEGYKLENIRKVSFLLVWLYSLVKLQNFKLSDFTKDCPYILREGQVDKNSDENS